MSVQFCVKSLVFSFHVTVLLLFSFSLQKTLTSVILPRYESLKLNHDTNYLVTSEDTVEDPLMSVQFYMKSKSFFFSCYSPSTFIIFITKKTLKYVFVQRYEFLKLNHGRNHLMTSEDTVDDPLMSVQFYIKSMVFSFRVTVDLLLSFYCKRRLNLYFTTL